MKSPTASDGEGNGFPARVTPPAPEATEAATGVAKPNVGQTAAPQPALAGEPDTLPLTYCRKCQVEVKPEGKGRCPRCQTFLRLNFVARRHPVNVLRRDALLAELVADYQPNTTMLRSTCAHLAGTLEQLEVMKPGSPDWQRLVQTAQTLGAALHDARPTPPRTATNYDSLTEDQLIERLEVMLKSCYERRDSKLK
jgi:hypothetical protein